MSATRRGQVRSVNHWYDGSSKAVENSENGLGRPFYCGILAAMRNLAATAGSNAQQPQFCPNSAKPVRLLRLPASYTRWHGEFGGIQPVG